MRLSDLLGAKVVSDNGEVLGHIHDVRVRRLGHRTPDRRQFRVTGLVIGSRGLRERIGLDTSRSNAEIVDREFVPWDQITEIDNSQRHIVVSRRG